MLKSLAVLTVALGLTLLPAAAQVETIAYLPGVQKVISEKPSVLIFSAPWCMACRKLDGVLSKVKRQYKHDVDFTKVHVQDPKNLELVKRYDIHVIPTVVVLDSAGKMQSMILGYNPADLKVNLKVVGSR